MPTIQHNGATIRYEEYGSGFPILTFAPAGLRSVIDVWGQPSAPINPTTEFAARYRVIAMDQRNAGASRAHRSPPATAGTATPTTISRCSTICASTSATSTGSASAARLSSTC